MDVAEILVVATLVVGAVAAYLFFASRAAATAREADAVPVLRTPPLKVKPFLQPSNGVRPPEAAATAPSPPPLPVPSAPLFDVDLEPTAPKSPAEIRWAKQFDPRSETLDDTARLRLIGDLGVVAKDWCIPLLAQAYREEQRPGHRQAALIALAACRSRAATPTFRLALGSGDPAERAIAADGLADLEPAAPARVRRTVERN